MGQRLPLEVLERLPEGGRELAVPVAARGAGPEVVHDVVEPVARDQVVREQVGQLVRGLRPLAQVAHGESARRAERFEIKAARDDRPVVAHGFHRHEPPPHHRVQTQALEHAIRRPLGETLGQPLLGASLAFGELDLRDVGELMRHQPHPLRAADVGLLMQEQLPALAHAQREVAQLGGADARDAAVVHQALLEDLS